MAGLQEVSLPLLNKKFNARCLATLIKKQLMLACVIAHIIPFCMLQILSPSQLYTGFLLLYGAKQLSGSTPEVAAF